MASPFKTPRSLTPVPDLERMNSEDVKHITELNKWSCCCFSHTTDSRLIRFLGQYLILFMVFVFTLTMLFNAESCEDVQGYMSLLTLLLGIIIPNPK